MPFTVSCAACDSRFLLGDDLFRRKVSGKVVTVKCRNCSAEISVDATEPDTLPSQEPPRRRPAPPRPKHKGAEAATASATTTATTTRSATATPLSAATSDSLSIWDAEEWDPAPARKPPPPRAHERDFIDEIEEPPPSSSDAPSLNSLTHESAPKKRTTTKKAPDDFLVNLSTGNGGILGAPTIDVTGFGSHVSPKDEELLEVEATEVTPHAGTVPLFDMSAVLPPAKRAPPVQASSLSPSHVDLEIDVELPDAANRAGTARERKYAKAPPVSGEAPARRRAGGAVWFGLVAAAAGVVAIVGIRGHASRQPEPAPAAHPSALADNAPAVSEPVPLAAPSTNNVGPLTALEAPGIAKAQQSGAAAPVSGGAPTPSSAGSLAKSTPDTKPANEENPKADPAPAVEKPAEPEKPTALTPKPAPEPAEPGSEFDRGAAVAALKAAAAEASACRKDGDPSGTASLTITFAPSGRVTSANIQGPPFAGTPTGGCIANAMRHAQVPPFSGERVTVSKTIVVQ